MFGCSGFPFGVEKLDVHPSRNPISAAKVLFFFELRK